MKSLRNKRGFTLMEVIIVLVILAILAALLIPALTGYVDMANENTCLVECRHFITAAQTLSVEKYAAHTLDELDKCTPEVRDAFFKECFVLSELDSGGTQPAVKKVSLTITSKGKVTDVTYTDGYFTTVYKNGEFSVTEGVTIKDNSLTVSDGGSIPDNNTSVST